MSVLNLIRIVGRMHSRRFAFAAIVRNDPLNDADIDMRRRLSASIIIGGSRRSIPSAQLNSSSIWNCVEAED